MKKWIRWKGLIAFVVVAVVMTVFWIFFADNLVRRVVERTGTALAGAEVDVAGARIALSPLGITLSGIQVTDPKNPATNSLEIGRVAFSLDGMNLLRRKVIIQEMAAEGLRFGTTRTRPGTVAAPKEPKPAETKKKSSSFTLPSFEAPDAKKILATENFASVKLIDDADAKVKAMQDDWQKRINELPNKSTISAYRSRLDKLRVSTRSSLRDLAGAASEAKKLTDDISRDLDRTKKARQALNTDLASAKNLVSKAEQGPMDDVRRIRDKYSLSPSGLQNISQALLGHTITSWFDTGLVWYDRAAPLLSAATTKKGDIKVVKPVRGKGLDVKFPERNPLPDFLIRTVKASLQPEAGSFSGTIRNITTDQDVINRPLTFQFNGSEMKDVRALSITGALDHIRPDRFDDSVRIQADGYRVDDMALSNSKELPMVLRDGLMDLSVKGNRGPTGLKATLNAAFRSVRIDTGTQQGGGAVLASLRSALSRVSNFSLTADIDGTPGNYAVKVSSDLDRVFKDAVGRTVQEQSRKLEEELKTAVRTKTDGKLKDLKANLGGLNSLGGNIDQTGNQLNALLQDAAKKAGGNVRSLF
jgi:uncharacterized protein (TIGR03545 family)